jgi:hypothetical protein
VLRKKRVVSRVSVERIAMQVEVVFKPVPEIDYGAGRGQPELFAES